MNRVMSKRDADMEERLDTEQPPAEAEGDSDAVGDVAEDELTTLRLEVATLRDKNLRLVAEAQNQQKRAVREREDALRFAEADFARDLLVILDDLERTLASAQGADDAGAVADGVRIVYEHFLKVLGTREISPIEAVGQPFDPTYHEAMMQQPSDEHPAGTVMQELARGYTMRDRVLRSARVIVSSGATAPGAGRDQE
jgi:molecular chaperone GrpE